MKLTIPRITKVESGGEPQGRLTEMADTMITTFESHPLHQNGDKCILLLDDKGQGGIALVGYAEPAEVVSGMLLHLRAFLRTQGKDIRLEVEKMEQDTVLDD